MPAVPDDVLSGPSRLRELRCEAMDPLGVENSILSCGDRLVLVDEPTEQIFPSDLGDPRSRINAR